MDLLAALAVRLGRARAGLVAAFLLVALAVSAGQGAAQTPGPVPTPRGQGGVSGTVPAGWNLIAGPDATLTGAADPLYTFPSGATAYETVSSTTQLQPGVGYWAYFPSPGEIAIGPPGLFKVVSIDLSSAGFAMIGDPYGVPVTVMGADALYTYDPTSGQYQQTTTLQSGQGAWVYVAAPSTITLSPPPQYIH